MEPVTVAAVQVAPVPGPLTTDVVSANLDHAVDRLRACVAETGADLVVFPESATTGYTTGLSAAALWELVSPIPGPVTDPIAEAAADLGVTVVWGTYERGPERGQVFNSAATIGPDGQVLGVYRKTHLYVLEHQDTGGWVTPGDQATVVDTPAGRIGSTICFDGDFPELSRINAVLGAEIVVRPSAFLRSADIWELTTRARAYDNHTYVVAANAVGQDPAGTVYFGNSLIVGPTAQVLARATAQEGWVSARLDPDPLRAISQGSSVPQIFDHVENRNLALYARYGHHLALPSAAPFPRAPHPGA